MIVEDKEKEECGFIWYKEIFGVSSDNEHNCILKEDHKEDRHVCKCGFTCPIILVS